MKRISTVVFFAILYLSGCAPTLPDKSAVNNTYSIADAGTYASVVDCEYTQSTQVRPEFVEVYCLALDENIKTALRKVNRHLVYDEDNPTLVVNTTLEEIHGGSAAARFWIGFGAGRSITSVYVKVLKNNTIIAERRITETTAMSNLLRIVDNEEVILKDAPQVAKKISRFVKDPVQFEKEQNQQGDGDDV